MAWSKAGRWAPLIALGLALVGVGPVAAQELEGFEVQRFHPATSMRTGYFTMDSGQSIPGGGWEAGLLVQYGDDPFVARENDERVFSVVAGQLVAHLHGAYAPIQNLQIALDVPVIVLQTADDELPMLGGTGALEGAGIGDVRLTPKWTFVHQRTPGRGGIDAALLVAVSLPTGDRDALQGGGFQVEPRLAADYASANGFGVGLNVGFLVRDAQELDNLEIGNQLTWAVGARAPLAGRADHTGPAPLQLLLEVNGGLTVGADDAGEEETPIEALLGGRLRLGGVYLTAGGGTGLSRGAGTPDFRAFLGLAYSTGDEPADRDNDTILDADDACPDDPEDLDGFEDSDGCPDPDNDGDGFEDDDGCPEEGPAIVHPERIEITSQIQFDYDDATLRPGSRPILDGVSQVLIDNEQILLVHIEGHTSTEGTSAHNLDLSRRRAQAVLQALVDRGVAAERLASEGFGETQPIEPDESVPGAAERNRRVEFRILERAEDDTGTE